MLSKILSESECNQLLEEIQSVKAFSDWAKNAIQRKIPRVSVAGHQKQGIAKIVNNDLNDWKREVVGISKQRKPNVSDFAAFLKNKYQLNDDELTKISGIDMSNPDNPLPTDLRKPIESSFLIARNRKYSNSDNRDSNSSRISNQQTSQHSTLGLPNQMVTSKTQTTQLDVPAMLADILSRLKRLESDQNNEQSVPTAAQPSSNNIGRGGPTKQGGWGDWKNK